ncbi:MAG: hypothetical protein WAX16_03205, partial [Lactococcus raffinolactis]
NTIQESITSDYRATILSILSLITSLSSSFFYLFLGFIHQSYGSKLMLDLISALDLFTMLCFCVMNHHIRLVMRKDA